MPEEVAQWVEGVYPGGASCGCVLVILVACFPKQALVSADMADRVLETSETRATTASVNIGSSPSKSLGSLRLGTISFSWELTAWAAALPPWRGQDSTQHPRVVSEKLSRPCV